MAITQPPILFDKPFADAGDKTIIPSAAVAAGKANLQEGFPPITQVPLGSGGIAPDRLDFNGILYMLSAYAHWMQSGGMFAWSDTLDYAVPSIVYQGGEFYACLAESGPGTTVGAQDPATATTYWGNIGGDVVFDKLATARLISTDPTQTAGKLFDGSAPIAIGIAPSLTDGTATPTLPPVGTATALTALLNTIRNNLKWAINTVNSGPVVSTFLYPNGGSAASPANVTNNTRYVLSSPWPGYKVKCEAQVKYNNQWGNAGWLYGGASASQGTRATQLDNNIIVQTGVNYVIGDAKYSGGSFPLVTVASAPCRIYCEKGGPLP